MRIFIILLCLFMFHSVSYAWDGEAEDTGNCVRIDKGNLVRKGLDIEFYDCEDEEYREANVNYIKSGNGVVELEVYDYKKEEDRLFIMERK